MAIPLPTLDTKGNVTDPSLKMQWLLSYLVTTEASQTNLHRGRVLSIPDMNRKFGNDPMSFAKTIEEALKRSLDVYFDDSQVYATHEPMSDLTKYKLVIKARALEAGIWYDLSEILLVSKDKVERVAELHNV